MKKKISQSQNSDTNTLFFCMKKVGPVLACVTPVLAFAHEQNFSELY